MEQNKKYASINQLINLPKKRPIYHSLFVGFKNQPESVTPEIKKSRGQLIENIQKQLQIFEQAETYNFKFPSSKFPEVAPGERNRISYEQKVQAEQEDTFKDKLSNEQIQQIRLKGQFQVKSNMKNVKIPYVWKINDKLVRGRENIINIWENGLAFCYSIFYDAMEIVKIQVPKNVKRLAHLPVEFFTVIFGRRSLTAVYTPSYQQQVFKDFWNDIMANQLKNLNKQIGHEFLNKLYLKYEPAMYERVEYNDQMTHQQRDTKNRIAEEKRQDYRQKKRRIEDFKNDIIAVENKFQNNWVKIRRRTLINVTNQIENARQRKQEENDAAENEKRDQQILNKFHEQKYLMYTAHLKQNLPKNLGLNVIQALTSLITIFSLISDKTQIKEKKIIEVQKKIRSDIKNKYKIRSKNHKFFQATVSDQFNPIKKQIQDEFYRNLILDQSINNLLNDQYRSIYAKYVELRKNFEQKVGLKKEVLKKIYVPERVFRTTYRLLPPYQMLHNNGYYTLVKEREMNIDTSTNFWKFKLYAMRMKSWTINCVVFLLGFSWVGPFGLRCLYGTSDFKYDQYCNSYSGERLHYTRPTVLGQFIKVHQGVQKSRQYFQSLPDRGLFGKKFSRYFNYLQCYVFRWFFVGVIGVLILYPILIVVLSVLCILLVLTIWAWVPLIMIVCYLFNVFIFQFQSSDRRSGLNITGVPLISLAFRILAILIQCVFSIIFLLIITPLTTGFYSLFLIMQRGFRTFTDAIMIAVIAKLGRTPSRDTAIAKKISGPSMSRNYFFSINEQDVYVLVQAHLEKQFVNKFIQLTKNLINSHTKKYREIMEYVLQPFGYSSPSLTSDRDSVIANKNYLLNHFSNKSQHYLARYPNNPYNIRFTEEQIDLYFENSVKIVKNFVERQKIADWIFDDYSVLHEDYEQLTRSIWISIFNSGQQIFQPLEKIDTRFKMSEQQDSSNQVRMRKNIGSVMKALEGQIQLSHRQAKFNPAKRSLLDRDNQISFISQICQCHSQNSQLNINVDFENPKCLFVPNRNLSDIKAYDEYQKGERVRNLDKYFQEL